MTIDRNERVFAETESLLSMRRTSSGAVKDLKLHFASGQAMMNGGSLLDSQNGLHKHDALLLRRIPDLSRYLECASYGIHPQVGTLKRAAAYLRSVCAGLQSEHFYLLSVDAKGKLIRCTCLQEGTDDSALFDLRSLLAEAARFNPAGIVLSHNHPGGTLHPSRDDVTCTDEAIQSLSSLGIPLLDHIIIAGKHAVSLRDNGFIAVDKWLNQPGGNSLLRNWLE